ncbi:hypothetical protein FXE80_01000 [Vibrio cholerae]|uniref:strawberry notch-like NTP hydrolase domain-containing protein n=1 Tax=Vibrio cholerae TaxID=666 RepID=UPI000E698B04|nr:strawberry notch C-terminal domain-containing protein [Vibrio cholerae]TXY77964.1 hypothetical protein FXE80_01000 [Vibrio cholerae]GIB16661.1 hypothetical protein VCSRO90_2781 [Vibrio cholerae]
MKWLDLSRCNASLNPINVGKGEDKKQALILIGDLSSDQKNTLINKFGFHHYPKVTDFSVLITTKYTKKSTAKISLSHIPFEEISALFEGSLLRDMDPNDVTALWPGMHKSSYNAIAAFINTDRAKRALDSYESIGLNEEGNEIFLTPTDERFIFPSTVNPDHLLFFRGVNPHYFLKFEFQKSSDYVSAATALLREMEAGKIVDQDRLDGLIETSGLNIRIGSMEAAKIQSMIVKQIESLYLADVYRSFNKEEIDQAKLSEINNIFTNLVESSRHKKFEQLSYSKGLSPAFGYLARKCFDSANNTDYISVLNESALGAITLLPTEIPIQLLSSSQPVLKDNFNQVSGKLNHTYLNFDEDQRVRGKLIIANPEFKLLSNPQNIDNITVSRADHLHALNLCKGMDDDARLMLIVNGDNLDSIGQVGLESSEFHQYLFRNYNVVEMADFSPQLIGSYESSNLKRVYLINGRRLVESLTPAPTDLKTVYNIGDLMELSKKVPLMFAETEVQTKSRHELINSTSVSELLQNYSAAHKQASKFELNFAQALYVPLTKLVESKPSAQPINFVSASREASIKLVRDVGNPDQFLLEEIGLPIDLVQEVWDAEQIDALTMAIWRLKNGKPFLEADMTGKGKGRVLAGLIHWNIKRGVLPIFMTSSVDLLSDIWRDIRETKLDQFINPIFVSNDDIVDKETKEILFGKDQIVEMRNRVISNKLSPTQVGANAIFTTYTQINTLKKTPEKKKNISLDSRLNERAKWLIELTKSSRSIMIADESHNVASSTSNQSLVFDKIKKSCSEPIVRSSATWSKDEQSISKCSDLFPPQFTEEMLRKMVRKGGTGVQELLAATLIAEGAMVRREHDFGNRHVEVIESQDYLRNREATDVMAKIMTMARSYTKRQYEILRNRIRHLNPTIQDVEEYSFSSTFSLLADSFTNSMRADECVRACISAINAKEKPIIGVDKHGGATLNYLFEILSSSQPDVEAFVMNDFPSFKTMLQRWTENEGSRRIKITLPPTAAEIALAKKEKRAPKDAVETIRLHWRDELEPQSTEYAELEELEAKIYALIEHMPFLPLSPIDYVKCQLESQGITSTEVSGRNIEINLNADGSYTLCRRDELSKADAQFRFNSDQANVIFITKAGVEGISLHAQESFLKYSPNAANKRTTILLGTFLYIIDEEQFFGRSERKGQLQRARFAKITTGMPIESRMLALSERNRLKLSASTTGNSKSLKATATVPNFLNSFGDRVTAEFLFDNQYILDLLVFDDVKKKAILEYGENAERQNQIRSLTGSVLGRMMLLNYEQQQSLLDELSQFFNTKLGILQARGLDPLNTKVIAGDIRVLEERVLLGKSSNHYRSEFDRPVIGQTVEVAYKSRTIQPSTIMQEIALSNKALENRHGIKDGKVSEFALKLLSKHQEMLQHALMTANNRIYSLSGQKQIFNSVSDALASNTINHVKSVNDFINKTIKLLKYVELGDVLTLPSFNKSLVITGVELPTEVDDYTYSTKYKFIATTTTGEESKEIALDTMYYYLGENADNYKLQHLGKYDEFHPINEVFENISIHGAKEVFSLLTGNLLESSRINAEKLLGQQVTLKGNDGQSYSAVKLKNEFTLNNISNINFSAPYTLKSELQKVANYNLFGSGLALTLLHRLDKEAETETRLFLNRDPLFTVELPKTLVGRRELDRDNPFDGIEVDKQNHDSRSNTYRKYRFRKSDLTQVLDILNDAGFKIELSMRDIAFIQSAVKDYEDSLDINKTNNFDEIEDAIYSSIEDSGAYDHQKDESLDSDHALESQDPLDALFNTNMR